MADPQKTHSDKCIATYDPKTKLIQRFNRYCLSKRNTILYIVERDNLIMKEFDHVPLFFSNIYMDENNELQYKVSHEALHSIFCYQCDIDIEYNERYLDFKKFPILSKEKKEVKKNLKYLKNLKETIDPKTIKLEPKDWSIIDNRIPETPEHIIKYVREHMKKHNYKQNLI
jgi:hypothetical protein